MNEKAKASMKAKLVDLKLMSPDDNIVDGLNASYAEMLNSKMGTWKQGWIFFTETSIVYPTGLLDENIVIPYCNIRQIGTCMQMFLPLGITVTHENPETGKVVTNRFSMMGRDKWIAFLNEKMAAARV